MQTSDFPRLEDLSENGNSVTRGTSIDRQIKISNPSDQRIEVDLWIRATDENSVPLVNWCRYSEPNPLALAGDRSRSITLTFEVPQQATPGIYNYEICLEAAQFPGKALHRPQQLRVVSSDQDGRLDTTPRFSVQPFTSSAEPHPLNAGQPVEITVQVENRSRRNERFHLICPDKAEWAFQPSLAGYGLELLPGAIGEIKALLSPPPYTPAGYYQPTLQLVANTEKNLVLLDVIYLQILVDDRLQVEMYPATRRIPEEPGVFDLTLFNQGNIKRDLTLQAGDPARVAAQYRAGLFRYALDETEVTVAPGKSHYVTLRAKPRRRWKRPLWGKGMQVAFEVELLQPLETPTRSLPAASQLALPAPSQGTLVWQARPLRHLLLFALLLLALLGTIAFAIWRLLFWQPSSPPLPPTPEIARFGAYQPSDSNGKLTHISYQEGKNTPVRLDWEVRHLSQIRRVSIVQLDGNTEVYRKSYNFLPNEPAGDRIARQLQKSDPNGRNFCRELEPTALRADEQKPEPTGSAFNQFFARLFSMPLKLFQSPDAASQDTQQATNETMLSCQGIITPVKQAGDYVFKIEVFASNSQPSSPPQQSRWNRWFRRQASTPQAPQNLEQPVATRVTDTISVAPPPPPALLPVLISFASTQPVYEEVSAAASSNSAASANSPSNPPRPAPGAIRLNWEIANPKQIQELRLVSLASDGAIDRELKRYTVSNGVPTELRQFCTSGSNLICRNVPTGIQAVGAYKFKLVVVPKKPTRPSPQPLPSGTPQPPNASEIALVTPEIKIQARPPQIKQFIVNGRDVLAHPKQVYVVNPARAPIDVQVSWEVEDGKAQLLPAPGEVAPAGSMVIPVGSPAQETITLQVTNASGVQITQSVVIQVMEFTPPEQSPVNSPSQPATPGVNPPPSPPLLPSNPNQLSPFELPPRPD